MIFNASELKSVITEISLWLANRPQLNLPIQGSKLKQADQIKLLGVTLNHYYCGLSMFTMLL